MPWIQYLFSPRLNSPLVWRITTLLTPTQTIMNRLFIFLVILLCTACPNDTKLEIGGQDWQLASWTAGALPEGISITATFADGRLSGKGICNQYFADATITNDSVLIKSIGATKMLCPQHADIEQQYLKHLKVASSFRIEKEQLALQCGDATLYFIPIEEE